MHIQFTTRKIPMRRSLQAFVTDSLSAALERFAAYIAVVQVELADRNGRRGGGDKRCRITLRLRTGLPVLVEDVQASPRRAILHAASRAQSALRIQLRPA